MTTHRKLFSFVLVAWTLGVTLARGLRGPNDFAEAHWLLGYRFGFVKRGLPGEVLALLTGVVGAPVSEGAIFLVSSVVFAAWLLVLLGLGHHLLQRSGWSVGALAMCLAFFSSPFVVMTAHVFGYFDSLVMMLGLASVALLLRGHGWLGASLQCLALLIHESAGVVAFPGFCLAWLLVGTQRLAAGGARPSAALLAAPVLAWAALAASQRGFNGEVFFRAYSAWLHQHPFVEGGSANMVPRYIARSFSSYYDEQAPAFVPRLMAPAMHALVLPTVAALLSWLVDTRRIRVGSVELALLLGVVLAPQVIHIAAWDTPRIWTYSIFSAFFAVWIYTCAVPGASSGPGARLLAVLAMGLNAVMFTPLMDQRVENLSLGVKVVLYAPIYLGFVGLVLTDRRLAWTERLNLQDTPLDRLLLPEGLEWDEPEPPPPARGT